MVDAPSLTVYKSTLGGSLNYYLLKLFGGRSLDCNTGGETRLLQWSLPALESTQNGS